MRKPLTQVATVPAEDRSEFICIGAARLRVTPTIRTAYSFFLRDEHKTSTTDAINCLLYDGLSLRGYVPIVKTRDVTVRDASDEIEFRLEQCMRTTGKTRQEAVLYFLDLGSRRAELHAYQEKEEANEVRMTG